MKVFSSVSISVIMEKGFNNKEDKRGMMLLTPLPLGRRLKDEKVVSL
jgi:hypothetical protein